MWKGYKTSYLCRKGIVGCDELFLRNSCILVVLNRFIYICLNTHCPKLNLKHIHTQDGAGCCCGRGFASNANSTHTLPAGTPLQTIHQVAGKGIKRHERTGKEGKQRGVESEWEGWVRGNSRFGDDIPLYRLFLVEIMFIRSLIEVLLYILVVQYL